jgi:regulator of sigma E protease
VVVPQIVEFADCCTFNTEDGLHLGDEILEIDGEKVYTNNDITLLLNLNPNGVHDLVIRRGNEVLEFSDYPMAHRHPNQNGEDYRHYGFGFGQVKDATIADRMSFIFRAAADNVRMVRLSLGMLFSGQAGIQDVSGPVGIISEMSDIAESSETAWIAFINLLSVGAFLAINLAVMNLLPIPALDGGRAVCLLLTTAVEAVIGRKIDPKYEGYLHAAGMILLLGFMAFVMFKDIFVLFKG